MNKNYYLLFKNNYLFSDPFETAEECLEFGLLF